MTSDKNLKNLANPHCKYCLGEGKRNNGYFSYPCNCVHIKPLFPTEVERAIDMNITLPVPSKTFAISPFTITEIQYLRGLINSDQISNDYENVGMDARIDQRTSMFEFTQKIMEKFDEFEEGVLGIENARS